MDTHLHQSLEQFPTVLLHFIRTYLTGRIHLLVQQAPEPDAEPVVPDAEDWDSDDDSEHPSTLEMVVVHIQSDDRQYHESINHISFRYPVRAVQMARSGDILYIFPSYDSNDKLLRYSITGNILLSSTRLEDIEEMVTIPQNDNNDHNNCIVLAQGDLHLWETKQEKIIHSTTSILHALGSSKCIVNNCIYVIGGSKINGDAQ